MYFQIFPVLLKNPSGFESPIFVCTGLRGQATGSGLHNAPELQEARARGYKHPAMFPAASKFSATVGTFWQRAHMHSEGNLTSNRKL